MNGGENAQKTRRISNLFDLVARSTCEHVKLSGSVAIESIEKLLGIQPSNYVRKKSVMGIALINQLKLHVLCSVKCYIL